MTSRDLKKQNQYRRVSNRPSGCPVEILTLHNGKVIGAYGIRRQVEEETQAISWWYLINPTTLEWINASQVKQVEGWTEKGQAKLDKKLDGKSDKKSEKKSSKTQQQIKFGCPSTAMRMVFTIQRTGGEQPMKPVKIITDFKGNLLNTNIEKLLTKEKELNTLNTSEIKGDNTTGVKASRKQTITTYLKCLTSRYGKENIHYTYSLQ